MIQRISVLTITLAIVTLMPLTGCRGSKETAMSKGSQKKPKTETTDEKLKNEALMIDAKLKLEMGQVEAGENALRILLANDPHCHAAEYELSRILAAKNMTDSAIVYAEHAANGDGNNTWYMINLAQMYKTGNQISSYIKTWEKIVAVNPDVIDNYYELSNAYLMNNDMKGAIATLNRIEKIVGVTEPVSLQKAKIWTHINRNDKALEEIEALAKSKPQDSKYNGILAESYMSEGQYDKAKACYDRVLATNPDDEYIHISLAEYYKATKQPRKAYEELKIGMAQRNLSTANKLQILTKFYTSEEFYGIHSEYAFDLMETAMRGADDSTTYAAFYGDILVRQRKYKEAAHQFALSLTRDSSKYEVWEALLISELSSYDDTARLARDARRASQLFPLHLLPYYIQAVVEHDNGHYERAIELSKQCEQLGFDKGYLETETYVMLAECYNRLDDSRCYEYYEKVLKATPNDVRIMNSYAYRLAQDKKDLEKAERMSRRTLEAEPDNPYYLDTYGWVLHQMGRDKEALPYIEKALRRDDSSDEVKEHLNVIKASINRQ
ncbi:MAG: tetratricopeptide repeat protein [Bacteroidales bacterium]|nr:tetratricopeptide repeat protein [Bacteroidales bacterium]